MNNKKQKLIFDVIVDGENHGSIVSLTQCCNVLRCEGDLDNLSFDESFYKKHMNEIKKSISEIKKIDTFQIPPKKSRKEVIKKLSEAYQEFERGMLICLK